MNEKPPRLSLVTPVFNGARYLQATLSSVLDQNYPDLDYLVVDGGSTDGSLDIIRANQTRLSSWLSEPDRGMYDALNKGFARSDGEIMGWLNADDLHLGWTLSVVGDIFAAHPEIEWITSAFPLSWDERGRAVRCRRRPGFGAKEFLAGGYLPAPERPGAFWLQQESTFWRRSLWERAGARLDDRLKAAGDFDLWARFFQQARLFAVDCPLAGFRRHPEQLTARAASLYAQESAAALHRHGGKPRGLLRQRLKQIYSRLAGEPLQGPLVVFDWRSQGWRVENA